QRELVEKVGGFRPGYEGSQDHDLILRCVDGAEPHQITHIPRVLYHWRASAASTALSAANKTYAMDSGLRAVRDAVQKRDPAALVTAGPLPFSYRLRNATPSPAPRVDLIIPTRDNLHHLRACVSSILERTEYTPLSLLIVDNGSEQPEVLRYLSELSTNE